MRNEPIGKYPTWLPKGKSAFAVPTPPDMPKLHGLFILAGHRGAGKGVAITSMLRQMKRARCCDRVFWLSPTCQSNKAYLDELGVKDADKHDSPDNGAIDAVLAAVDEEAREWQRYQEEKEVWAQLQRAMRRGGEAASLPPALLMRAERLGLLESEEPPKYRYSKDTPCVLHVVFDDCQGTRLMSSSGSKSKLTNLCIRHRHVGDGLGVTVWLCVQSWCASGSVPRAIRENCTGALVWKTPQAKMVEKMVEELATGREREGAFEEAYAVATEPQHGFLYVDLTTSDPSKRYRSGWDAYIVPDG
ncbi:TPA_asm: FtsK [Monoraphidium MELD virus]|nr:TPA_asm: FtsK [Monoraphidium MELD virus]